MNINNEDLINIFDSTIHSGIKSVSYGWKIKNGETTDNLSVIFGVEKKLSTNELSGKYDIPPTININGIDYETDVIEQSDISIVPEIMAGTPESPIHYQKVRPLMAGTQIFGGIYNGAGGTAGTLGLICQDKITKAVVGLTNTHVIYPNGVINRWTRYADVHRTAVINNASGPNTTGSLMFFPRIKGWSSFDQAGYPDGTALYPYAESWPWIYVSNSKTLLDSTKYVLSEHENFGIVSHTFIAQGTDLTNRRADTIGTVCRVNPIFGTNLCQFRGDLKCTTIKNTMDASLIAIQKIGGDNLAIIDSANSYNFYNLTGVNAPLSAAKYSTSVFPWATTEELDTLLTGRIPLATVGRTLGVRKSPIVFTPGIYGQLVVIGSNVTGELRVTQMQGAARIVGYGYGNEYVGVNKDTNYNPNPPLSTPNEMTADFTDLCKVEMVNVATNSVLGSPIVQGGDSGSSVLGLFGSTWKVVGLLFAGSNSSFWFSRIDTIRDKMQIEPLDAAQSPRKYLKIDSPKVAFEFAGYDFTEFTVSKTKKIVNFEVSQDGLAGCKDCQGLGLRLIKNKVGFPNPLLNHTLPWSPSNLVNSSWRYQLIPQLTYSSYYGTNATLFDSDSNTWFIAGLISDERFIYNFVKNYESNLKNWCNTLKGLYPLYVSTYAPIPQCS